MKPKLIIKSASNHKSISIPIGSDFYIYPWGFSEIKCRYTKHGNVIMYHRERFKIGSSYSHRDVVVERYKSAKSFIKSFNNLIIETPDGIEAYWDLLIYYNNNDIYASK